MTAGRFKPGTSGNPAGRKPGTGEVAKLRASIAAHVPAIVKKLVEQAAAGDVGAARLLLERAIPPLKATEEPLRVALPAGTLSAQGQAVVSAIASGELAPAQGAALLASLGSLVKLTEADELERRIESLEAIYGKTSGEKRDHDCPSDCKA